MSPTVSHKNPYLPTATDAVSGPPMTDATPVNYVEGVLAAESSDGHETLCLVEVVAGELSYVEVSTTQGRYDRTYFSDLSQPADSNGVSVNLVVESLRAALDRTDKPGALQLRHTKIHESSVVLHFCHSAPRRGDFQICLY